MPSDLEDAVARFSAELNTGPVGDAQQQLLTTWARSWAGIDQALGQLLTQVKAAEAAGQTIKPWWVFQQARYEALQRQVALQVQVYAEQAALIIDADTARAVQMALGHADQLGALAFADAPRGLLASWATLPSGAQQQLVGALTGHGSPVRDLLGTFPTETAAMIRRELTLGLTLGHNADQLGRRIAAASKITPVRAVTIARTELLRAYREASHATYRVNSDVLEGWIWVSAASTRTCAACWAMHGTFHKLDEHLGGHPRCRCTPVPATKPWDRLGAPPGTADTRPVIESGAARFARLTADQQRHILGPAKFDAFKNGQIRLADLVRVRRSRRWGTTRSEAPLAVALTRAGHTPRGARRRR